MELNFLSSSLFLLLLLAIFSYLSSSSFISDGVCNSETLVNGRNLRQKKACPVKFEYLNYTVITSRCKAPKYPLKECCAAFRDFACPYAENLNDLSTDCAITMFKYIRLYGKYPPGFFGTKCIRDKGGITCPDLPCQ